MMSQRGAKLLELLPVRRRCHLLSMLASSANQMWARLGDLGLRQSLMGRVRRPHRIMARGGLGDPDTAENGDTGALAAMDNDDAKVGVALEGKNATAGPFMASNTKDGGGVTKLEGVISINL